MALVNSGKIAVPGLVKWDALDVDSSSFVLQIHKVEISNKAGADAEIGWGEELPFTFGKYASGTFTSHSLSGGTLALGVGENFAVISPKKFDVIYVDTSVASTGASTMGVYNGTNFTAATFTATYGSVSLASGDTTAIVAPQQSWIKGGITGYENMWIMVTGSAAGATISNVRIGRVIDYVSTVTDGSHAFREYSIEPLLLSKGQGLFTYHSDSAQTGSIATIDYQQI